MDLEFQDLGCRPGIFILGGQGKEGGWGVGVKDGSTGGQSEEGRDVCGGARMGCPSLSSSSLALLPPSCVQLLQLSDSSLTLSGSRRREFQGPRLYDGPAGTTAAGQTTPTDRDGRSI